MIRYSVIMALLLFVQAAYGQTYLLPNEEVVFSFETAKGKKMVLAKDKGNAYMVYRFGTKDKIEMEFPSQKDKSSFGKFTYSSYHRGGGISNEGMDMCHVFFVNDHYRYTMFRDYTARGNKVEVGVMVTDKKTKKSIFINGTVKSKKGNLCDFEDNGLIKIVDDSSVQED